MLDSNQIILVISAYFVTVVKSSTPVPSIIFYMNNLIFVNLIHYIVKNASVFKVGGIVFFEKRSARLGSKTTGMISDH